MSYPVNIGEAAQATGLTAKMIRDSEAGQLLLLYVGLAVWSRALNGCFAAQHA